MSQHKISILSTRPLADHLIEEAVARGISIDTLSFIDTEPIVSIEVQQEIQQALLQSTTVVFTSMNAVESVASYLEDVQPDWSIFTIGNSSQELVKKYFGEKALAGTARSAAELAELISEEGHPHEVIFFCGDQRRNELPDILMANEIEVNEIEVYRTIAIPHKLKRQYDGILFFSPSAVQSFFTANQLTHKSILFSIGETTAEMIKKYSANKIIISDSPGKENLVREMMEFFSEE